MPIFEINLFLIFIFGLCVGSFLNVVIDRLPKGKSIVFGRSYCDHCKKKLLGCDLVPLLSFILLKAKCRFCHKKISLQYPLVEFATGVLFAFTYLSLLSSHFSAARNAMHSVAGGLITYYLFLISGLVAIFVTDVKYRIIPDEILVSLGIGTLAYQFLNGLSLPNHLFAALGFFLFFLLLTLVTRGRGMGLGDVKFAFIIGLILGFPVVVIAFYLSFLTGAVFSLILVIGGKKTMKSTIPFGPFLSLATFISLYYGDSLWNIFRKMIGI